MDVGKKYMEQCIVLAKKGIGHVAPNPMVGCVLVHNGKVIGEGYHQEYGKAHAEVNAINSVANQGLLKGCTLYVTLEPCSHHGKTPPCSDLIIEKQIPNVVVGTIDPFIEVAGRGIEKLKAAGVQVETGVLEKECQDLNKRFFTFHKAKRPYVILKWAQTKDAFIDVDRGPGNYGQPTWITNGQARKYVHKTRAGEAAILVGKKTVLKDNPSLTVREWQGKNPTRFVLDRKLELPNTLNVFNNEAPTVVFNSLKNEGHGRLKYVKLDYHKGLVPQVLDYLYQHGIQSVIVEGGSYTLQGFIDLGLWDEAHIYEGPVYFYKGIAAPVIQGTSVCDMNFGGSKLKILENVHA